MQIDDLVILRDFAKQFNDLATAYHVHHGGPKIDELDTVAGESLDDLFRIIVNMVAHGEATTNHIWLAMSADRGRMAACNALANFSTAITIPQKAPTVVLAAPGDGAASPTRALASSTNNPPPADPDQAEGDAGGHRD